MADRRALIEYRGYFIIPRFIGHLKLADLDTDGMYDSGCGVSIAATWNPL